MFACWQPSVVGAEATIVLSAAGAVATRTYFSDYMWYSATSAVVMRAGRHYAQFMRLHGIPMFGVIHSAWWTGGPIVNALNPSEDEEAFSHARNCFYSPDDGTFSRNAWC